MKESTSPVYAPRSDEWRVAAKQAARWAEQASQLIKRTDHLLPAVESFQQSKIAASLALSATEAHGVKADKLWRCAANAAQNAAYHARVIIDYLNQTETIELKSQAQAWSKPIEIADRLTALMASTQARVQPKKRWPFW